MARETRSHCPVVFALDIFGDKWSLLILRDLIFKDMTSYDQLLNAGESISTNVLADRLERLKSEGLIRSSRDKSNGRRIHYAPTTKGLDLIPVILEIIDWSSKYDTRTAAPKEFLKMLKSDRRKLAELVRSKFETRQASSKKV